MQLLSSAAGSTLYFILFTLSVSFWGRLVLRGLGVKNDTGYGDPLPLITSIATLSLILRYVAYLTCDFDLLYSIFFILGLLGFVAEFILYLLSSKRAEQLNLSTILSKIRQHSRILVGIIVCFFFSVYLSAIWPSHSMEPWLSFNIDLYYWIFSTDYWRGFVDISKVSGPDVFGWVIDSFGTFVLFGLFASGKGSLTYMATPYFIVALLSWIGICVFKLIRSVFSLPRILAIFLTLGLLCSNFFNFLALYGYIGHMVAVLGFMTCLTVVFPKVPVTDTKIYVFSMFFPVLFIFLCYQAAFIVFAAIVFLAILLVGLFSQSATLRETLSKFPIILKDSLLRFGLPVLVIFILLPQVVIHTYFRAIRAGIQEAGLKLGFLDPTFFTGIPIYDEALVQHASHSSFWAYALYAIFIVILALFVGGRGNDSIDEFAKAKTRTISVLLLACIAVYIAYFQIRGNFYVVWKYAAYSILPLSFVATSLFFASICRLTKGKQPIFSVISFLFVVVFMVFPIVVVNSVFYGGIGKNTQQKSMSLLVLLLSQAHAFDKKADKTKVIFDFVYGPVNIAAAIMTIPAEYQKIYLTQGMYFFSRTNDYFSVFDDNTVLYTDKSFVGIYNSYYQKDKKADMIRYELADLKQMGAVAYIGLIPYSIYAQKQVVSIKILVPMHMLDKDINLKAEVHAEKYEDFPICRSILATYPDKRNIPESYFKDGFFNALIPKYEIKDGYINVDFHLPVEPLDMDHLPPDTKELSCDFYFKGVLLEPSDVAQAPEVVTQEPEGAIQELTEPTPDSTGVTQESPEDSQGSAADADAM